MKLEKNDRKTLTFSLKYRLLLDRTLSSVLTCVFVLMPVIVLCSISAVKHIDVFALSTVYNDEVSWFNQAIAVVEYGKPLGYWGYNGTHAPLGTFGAWGPVSVYFFALFLKPLRLLFPDADASIYIINNLLWACGANLLFAALAKPKKSNLIRLIVIYAFLFVNHCYMFEAMSETIRFSMSIILAGLVAYLLQKRTDSRYRITLYVIAPILILLFMSAYIMFAVVVPIWLYTVYKSNPGLKNRKGSYIAVSGIGFVVVSLLVYYVTCLYTSPYVTDGITDILSAFSSGIGDGFHFLLRYILNNISQCDLKFILSATDIYGGFFVFYLPCYYGICIYLIVTSVLRWKKMDIMEREIHVIGAFVMSGFMAAFILLYSTYYWILVRGINIALIFTIYLLCLKDRPLEIPVIAAVSLLGVIPFMLVANNTFIYGRAVDDQAMDYKPIFSQYIQISPESDPWENTVACYGDEDRTCLDLPVGMAINSMMNMKANQDARYALILLTKTTADELRIKDLDGLVEELEPNHDVLYWDDSLILLVRTTQ